MSKACKQDGSGLTKPARRHKPGYGFGWRGALALCLGALAIGACAKATVTSTRQADLGVVRPDFLVIYDFGVTPEDVQADRGVGAELMRDVGGASQSEEDVKIGRLVAKALAEALVKELRSRSIEAYRAGEGPPATERTATVRGQFVQIDEGNRTLRTLVGFGLGGGQVRTRVQIYQGVGQGERLIAGSETATEAGMKPGMGVMLGVGAAAGSLATAAVVSGGTTVVSETLFATVEADAKRTATELAKRVEGYYKRRGWM